MHMKKTISILLCVVMTVSLLSTAAFAQSLTNFQKTITYTQNRFSDVSTSDWFSLNVEAAYEYGLMNGRTSNTFGATDNITIAEVIVLAARLRSIYNLGSADFLTSTPWYQSYLDYAISAGITSYNEYSNYDAYATRLQFAKIMEAALPSAALTEINTVSIGDIPDLPLTGAYQSVYTLYRAGILTGKSTAGEFCPSDKVLRSEVAAIVTRMANADLRVKFYIVKAGVQYTGTQLLSTISIADDEIDLAIKYYNDAYSKATSGGYSSAAVSLDKANTYAQMAALYTSSAASVCKATSKYSAAYNGLYSTYQKCLQAMSGMSQLSAGSYMLSSDWEGPRTLLNECSAALIKSHVTINDLG